MTFGIRVGSFIGSSAALAVHGVKAGASYTGQFGADVVTGAQVGYAGKTAALVAKREQLLAERRAAALPAPAAKKAAPAKAAVRVRKVAVA